MCSVITRLVDRCRSFLPFGLTPPGGVAAGDAVPSSDVGRGGYDRSVIEDLAALGGVGGVQGVAGEAAKEVWDRWAGRRWTHGEQLNRPDR